MGSIRHLLSLGSVLSALCSAPWTASGADDNLPPGHTSFSHTSQKGSLFGNGVVSTEKLDGQRGGADSRLSKILATGTVDEVSASDLVTGHNIVTDGALANTSGMPMLIQNSGNGVLIQNAVIVNVELN